MESKAMPDRIARLDRDKRGYPIPWNVLCAEDGTPFFTVNDDVKTWTAIRRDLCPICGERLGRWRWFVGGILSAFDENGWYLDLPGHHDCICYALATCPYLAAPKYLGRIDVPDPSKLPPEVRTLMIDETMLPDRPEVFVAVPCDHMEARSRDPLSPYLRPARPVLVDECEYWRHGKRIGEAEADPFVQAALAKRKQEQPA